MFVIANDILYAARVAPFIDGGGLLAMVDGSGGGGLLCMIGFSQALITKTIINGVSGNLATIDTTGLSLKNVAALDISGVRYRASSNPSNLQPGEFFWDETGNQIIIGIC